MNPLAQRAIASVKELFGGHLFTTRAGRLATLRETLHARFSGKRCLVLGSAPNAVAPDPSTIDACICVNGSPWSAARLGIPKPELTVVTGHKTIRDNAVAHATRDIWQGLNTQTLLFIEIADSVRHAKAVFARSGFQYDEFLRVDATDREFILERVCGRTLARDARVSNGIFAAVVAIWAGASEIVFSGFSMRGGHSYITDETRRGHQEGDGRFFQTANDYGCRVTTTSDELHRTFGLPLKK